jgi:hypothetical protein
MKMWEEKERMTERKSLRVPRACHQVLIPPSHVLRTHQSVTTINMNVKGM